MQQWRFAVFILILAVVVLGIGRAFFQGEPVQKGRSLNQWLICISLRNPEYPQYEADAYKAIQAMGTNALPYLLKWISYEQRPSRTRDLLKVGLRGVPSAMIPRSLRNWVYVDMRLARAETVPRAFEALGALAAPAIPQLEEIAAEGGIPGMRAVQALAYIQKTTPTPLSTVPPGP